MSTLFAIGLCDGFMLMLVLALVTVAVGAALTAKAVVAPSNKVEGLAGKAATGVAKLALGQVVKGLRR